jgi:hypothetical protein
MPHFVSPRTMFFALFIGLANHSGLITVNTSVLKSIVSSTTNAVKSGISDLTAAAH